MARVTPSLAELEARQRQLDISHKNDIRELRQQMAEIKSVVGTLSDTIVSVDWKKLAAQVEPTVIQLAAMKPVVDKMSKILEGFVLIQVASANAFRTELAARKIEAQEQLGEDLEEEEEDEEEEEEEEDQGIEKVQETEDETNTEQDQTRGARQDQYIPRGASQESYRQSDADDILFAARSAQTS